MTPQEKHHLEARLCEAVHDLLAVGDPSYLHSVSPPAFREALQEELRFLGFYAGHDEEASRIIDGLVEHYCAQWYAACTPVGASPDSTTPRRVVQIAPSSLLQSWSTAGAGISLTPGTFYIGFYPHLDAVHVQNGTVPVEKQALS